MASLILEIVSRVLLIARRVCSLGVAGMRAWQSLLLKTSNGSSSSDECILDNYLLVGWYTSCFRHGHFGANQTRTVATASLNFSSLPLPL